MDVLLSWAWCALKVLLWTVGILLVVIIVVVGLAHAVLASPKCGRTRSMTRAFGAGSGSGLGLSCDGCDR